MIKHLTLLVQWLLGRPRVPSNAARPAPGGFKVPIRRRIAVHEAAHSVAARHLGRTVSLATIIATDNYAGAVFSGDGPPNHRAISTEDELKLVDIACGAMPEAGEKRKEAHGDRFMWIYETIIELMAGIAAELTLLGCEDDTVSHSSDRAKAMRLASKISAVPEQLVLLARAEAQALVERYRPAVLAVADALEAKAEMAGPEIDAVISWALGEEEARRERARRDGMTALAVRAREHELNAEPLPR